MLSSSIMTASALDSVGIKSAGFGSASRVQASAVSGVTTSLARCMTPYPYAISPSLAFEMLASPLSLLATP
jgi:hypothetical protein